MKNSSPMMRQYHEIKIRHPEALLFFRLGDFYEMFYEDAVVASRELEITLTSRNSDGTGKPIPMCGVPAHSVKTYLGKLISNGHRVAICEQVEDARLSKGIVRREVRRVITPGMLVEDGALDSKQNNFIASLFEDEAGVGASFLDLSTGEFVLAEFSGNTAWPQMQEEFLYFQPRELVLPESDQSQFESRLPESLRPSLLRTAQSDWVFNQDYSRRILIEHFNVATLEGLGINDQKAAICAGGALLNYVKQTQKSALNHVTEVRLSRPSRCLQLDESTVKNLELIQGLDGNKRWTLLATLDFTKTAMGGRLLRSWILRPSLDLQEIEDRLDGVEELQSSPVGMDRLSESLKSIQDLERLVSRVTLETAHARDLLALRESLGMLPELQQLLRGYRSSLLSAEIDPLQDVTDLLGIAIADHPPVTLNEGGMIQCGFHKELDELRAISSSGKSFIAQLESQEREKTGILSLKVRYNKVFGYFIEVTKSHLDSVPAHYVRKQTLVGCERFVTPELKGYEDKVLSAEERICDLEKALFVEVRSQVGEQVSRIQRTARLIARLDTLLSLAEAARKYRYVRPQLDDTGELNIHAGRHPVVELQSQKPFIPNDLYCSTGEDQLLILTGPNMGGKSTYLRQNALLVILAQLGSFIPAEEARIGLVDRIFTRVGASDNLAQGQSTFMVEMVETAKILHTTTRRSLILLDEVGRGTATFDGLSLAWSIAEYLTQESPRRARTLFATHYQELTKLDSLYPGVKNYCVTLKESGQDIVFLHRVSPGVARKSYGIEVARLAGLPALVIERAHQILSRLERKELNLFGRSHAVSTQVIAELQKTLF